MFDLAILLTTVLAVPAAGAADTGLVVFVGTYTGKGSDGIYAYRFDPATGESASLGLVAPTDNPSFLAVDPAGTVLYAVNELDTFDGRPTGAVSVFAIDRVSATLSLRQQVSSLGRGPAHVSLDETGRRLLVANYGGGNAAVFPIGADGRLGPRSAFVQHAGSSVNPKRQEGPHAHSIRTSRDNRLAVVADLGLDKLFLYRFDAKAGTLTPGRPAFVAMRPGSGPRHIAFHPSGRFVYVTNELTSGVSVLAYDSSAGTMVETQVVSTLPDGLAGANTAAEIVVDGAGRFLYVSNRGDDSIVVFGIDSNDGRLTRVDQTPSGGKTPRHFAIDPTGRWLFVANQHSNEIVLFEIDPKSGRLTPTGRSLKVISPVCVVFAATR